MRSARGNACNRVLTIQVQVDDRHLLTAPPLLQICKKDIPGYSYRIRGNGSSDEQSISWKERGKYLQGKIYCSFSVFRLHSNDEEVKTHAKETELRI